MNGELLDNERSRLDLKASNIDTDSGEGDREGACVEFLLSDEWYNDDVSTARSHRPTQLVEHQKLRQVDWAKL